jgi:hypothetical protein
MRPQLLTWLLMFTAVALAGCSTTRLGASPNRADWPQAEMSDDAKRRQMCETAHKRGCE